MHGSDEFEYVAENENAVTAVEFEHETTKIRKNEGTVIIVLGY